MYRSLMGLMNMLNIIFKTYQLYKILLFCVLIFEAGALHITTNISTKVNGVAGVWHIPDIMNYSIDVNRYNLDLSGITSLVFEVKRCGRAHVLLSSSDVRNSSEPLYGISIGYKTFKTFITYRADDSLDSDSMIFVKFLTPIVLNCTVHFPLWISWADGDIKLGTGIVVGENILGYLTNTPHFEVKSIGVLTDKGRLGNWRIHVEVSDTVPGYFSSCSMNNNKSDMVVVDNIKCSTLECAMSCQLSNTCAGFNFNSAINRCELLSFGSNGVTDIPFNIEVGWKFYSKSFERTTSCIGCCF